MVRSGGSSDEDEAAMAEKGAELTPIEVAVYRRLIDPPGLGVESLVREVGLPHPEVAAALANLVELRLLRHEDNRRYVAVSPDLAEAEALGSEELELSARRAEIERLRTRIRRVLPQWTDAARARVDVGATELVTEAEAITNVLMHFAESCEREVLSVSPERVPERLDGRTRRANLYSLGRGVQIRALYTHSALRDRATRTYLSDLAENGAQIRAAATLPGRSLVIDREVALLPVPFEDGSRPGLAVVREPHLVAWVVDMIERLWADATTLKDLLEGGPLTGELDQTRAAILRMLAEGEKDEAISRRLAISVRTCRRYIADYMAQVGATSRFQAGVIAAHEGHLGSTIETTIG
ncbi:MAG: helix-turn-helix domain-containing protein [Actinobacteria bacterium]|nr:helix-turn-helix domain-containing protein [Actinomycetota bacterium]